jgi:predicted esterase
MSFRHSCHGATSPQIAETAGMISLITMKRCAAAGVFLIGCVAVSSAALGQTSVAEGARKTLQQPGAPPQLTPPSGPFGIGRVGYDWIDATRADRFSTKPKSPRELMVYLWYPTKHQNIMGAYLPGAQQMNAEPKTQRQMMDYFGASWPLIVSGTIFSHTAEGVPVAENRKRFPVIVFSHGRGSSGFTYSSLIEDLVSHGYVVAAIEHTESAMAVWFPDGRIVPFHEEAMGAGLSPEEGFQRMAASIAAGISEGAADVRFLVDHLTEMNSGAERQFPLAGRLDLNRLAAMGHSAGAEFAARACQLDPRFKACVDLDGGMVPIMALPAFPDGATMKQPLLFLEADHPESQMGGTHEQHQEYFKKKEEQLESCPPGSYDVILKSPGIAHPSFSDIPLLFAGKDGYPETRVVLHNLELIETFVRAFLDKNLKQEKAPLLDGDKVTFPEATLKRYGQ